MVIRIQCFFGGCLELTHLADCLFSKVMNFNTTSRRSSLQSSVKTFRTMLGFKPEKMTLSYLIKLFLNTLRRLGNIPCVFHEHDLKVEVLNSRSWYYKFWLFNSWVCIAYWLKHVALLIRCHFLKYDIPQYELLVFWFAGSSTFMLYSVNLLINKQQFAEAVTTSIKLEKWMTSKSNYIKNF
jgi:hypothetical protein